MDGSNNSVRVAVVQAAPVIMDKAANVQKLLVLAEDAAAKGARIVLFPEAFIPAYPRGLSFGTVIGSRSPEGREDFFRYFDNSVTVPGKATEILGMAARKHGIYLVTGVIEREGGTL